MLLFNNNKTELSDKSNRIATNCNKFLQPGPIKTNRTACSRFYKFNTFVLIV